MLLKIIKRTAFFFITLLSYQATAQSNVSACISIPQNSGLAFVAYEMYVINGETLYVIKRSTNMRLIDTSSTTEIMNTYKFDTLATYPVSKEQLKKLADLIEHTDSLGQQTADGCDFTMGWPRFYIYANYNGKSMDGYIANCYREPIYKIVDLFNKTYPKGDVLGYNKDELILLEANCNRKVK